MNSTSLYNLAALTAALVMISSGTSLRGADSAPTVATSECRLALELPAVIKKGEYPQAKVRVTNAGTSPVTLVKPGDGSESAWRTPFIGWSILPAGSSAAHPPKHSARVGARCGNVNPLTPSEVFELKAGAHAELGDWVGLPPLLKPGKYRVVFYYANVPNSKWSGLPLGKHDEAAMTRVRSSTPVALMSNEVEVEFVE